MDSLERTPADATADRGLVCGRMILGAAASASDRRNARPRGQGVVHSRRSHDPREGQVKLA